jgi:hypothetical protein
MKKTTVKLNNGKDVDVFRTTNDNNGNPRYIVHFLSLGLANYEQTTKTKKAGLKLYTKKDFGGGFVFQSYNLKESLNFIFSELEKSPLDDFVAIYTESAFSGIGIYDFEYGIEDYAITSYFHNDKIERKRKNKINYDNDGNAYIMKNRQKYCLNEFMKK